MKNTVFPHKFWRPFLDCMPQLFFRPQYVWFPVHLKGHLIPLCYETLVVNWQNWLFTLFHQSRSVLSPNPIVKPGTLLLIILSLICKSDIKEVHGKLSNPLCGKDVGGQKHPREMDKCRNAIPYMNHFIISNILEKYCWHPAIWNCVFMQYHISSV